MVFGLAKRRLDEIRCSIKEEIILDVKETDEPYVMLDDFQIKVFYITTDNQLLNYLPHLLSQSSSFGLDIETYGLRQFEGDKQAGLEPRKSNIRLIQVYDGKKTVYVFDIKQLGDIQSLGQELWERPMVAHNAIFELKHLMHKGVYPKRLACTLLADRVLTGDRRELKEELGLSRTASLKDLAKEMLGLDISKEQQVSDWSQENLSKEQIEYAALDAVLTYLLFEIQNKQIRDRDLSRSYKILCQSQQSIARMELCGIGFNIFNHKNLITAWQEESERLEADIFSKIGRELNINSGKQMGAWLREALTEEELDIWTKTEKGQLSTSTPTFKLKEHLHDTIPKIVEYRHVSKRISSFGEGMYKFIDLSTNRLYGSFSLGTTVTGRMASHHPNMQNMPRDGFRSLFCAKEGYSLIGLDYSQQELRVAAIITGDEELLRIYQNGGDVHTNTASEILKIPKDKIGKEQRQLAKAVIFGLLYGQGAKGLARYAKSQYGVDMTEQEAERHRAGLFKLYKGLRKWQISTGRIVEITHKVRTPCGRERDFSRERLGYRYTAALNLPIQGAAAEITLSAVIRINDFICDDCQLVNVIHDEILLEVKDSRLDEFALLAKEAMEKGFLDVFPNAEPYLKGLVESKIGKNWAETK